MLAASLLGSGVALPVAASATLPTPAGVGPNLQVSPNDGNVYETVSAAIDPNDPSTIVAGAESWLPTSEYNFNGLRPVSVFRSFNAGASWSPPSLLPPDPPLPYDVNAVEGGSPSLAIDATGVTYAGSIAMHGGFHPAPSPSMVTRSLNHGATWSSQVLLSSDPSAVGDQLAVDRSGSPYRNRVYASLCDCVAESPVANVDIARSDNGTAWQHTLIASSTGVATNPAVASDGTLYVGVGGASFNQVAVMASTDGGATFHVPGAPVTVSTTASTFLQNYGTSACGPYITPDTSLAVDRSGGADDGILYLAWADNPSPPHVHVYFARSLDGGTTWSAPVQIDNGNPNDAWEPALTVDDAYGTVAVSWYDRRDDPNNKLYRSYYTQSIDGGASFLPAQIAVSSVQGDSTIDCTGQYASIVASHGMAHPFWTDSRTGSNEIFTATVSELTLARALGRPSAPGAPAVPWHSIAPAPLASSLSAATAAPAARSTPTLTLPHRGEGSVRSSPVLTLPRERGRRSQWFAPF